MTHQCMDRLLILLGSPVTRPDTLEETMRRTVQPDRPLWDRRAQSRNHPPGRMIAYNDDFALMLIVILASLPLLLWVRGPRRQPLPAAADD